MIHWTRWVGDVMNSNSISNYYRYCASPITLTSYRTNCLWREKLNVLRLKRTVQVYINNSILILRLVTRYVYRWGIGATRTCTRIVFQCDKIVGLYRITIVGRAPFSPPLCSAVVQNAPPHADIITVVTAAARPKDCITRVTLSTRSPKVKF